MSYVTNSEKDISRKEMFVTLSPKIRISSWTLSSGNIYYSDLAYGYVTGVSINGTAQTLHTSSSVGSGQFYYDSSTGRVYIYDVGGPAATDWVVVTFQLFLSTYSTAWYKDPTDDTTEVVNWQGIIKQTPVVAVSSGETLFGFSPVQATSVGCVYDPEYLQEFLYGCTFYRGEAVVYHQCGDQDTVNIVKILTGIGGSHSITESDFQVEITDKSYIFDEPMDNAGADDNFTAGDFDGTETDSNYVSVKIPTHYGGPNVWIRGVCMDYDPESPTTTRNRKWALCTRQFGNPDIGTPYLIKGNSFYRLTVTTHYTVGNLDNTTYGITLINNVEAALGVSTIDPINDYVLFKNISGVTVAATISGDTFQTNSESALLYHIVKERLNLSLAEVDTDSLFAAEAVRSDTISLSIPEAEAIEFPKYSEVINRLLASGVYRAFWNSSGQFSVKAVGPAVTADASFTDDDLFDVSYSFNTDDVYGAVNYKQYNKYYLYIDKTTPTTGVGEIAESYTEATASAEVATYMHNGTRETEVPAYRETNVTLWADLLGERRGLMSCFVKAGAFELELGDTVEISRTKLPGYAYDKDTLRTRSFVVTEIRKQIDGVYLVLDDQKVIEDNDSGAW